jgi:hypothetical protein
MFRCGRAHRLRGVHAEPCDRDVAALGSEARLAFPGVDGVVQRTVYVSSARIITIERGQTLHMEISKTEAPAPGVHLSDGKGHLITWVGYRQEPLLIQRIETSQEKLQYNSRSGKATRTQLAAPDAQMRGLLDALEGQLEDRGERTFAGLRCRAKHAPMFGPDAETCVVRIQGWPVALYLQMPGPEQNWYRATRIRHGVCPSPAEAALPHKPTLEQDSDEESQPGDDFFEDDDG